MGRLLRWVLILSVLGAMGWASYQPAAQYLRERNRVRYVEAEVKRGRVVAVRNSTGTVKPVRSVQVGAFVSGPIEEIRVEFNADVKKGELLAKIDPKLYEANVARDRALLATRIAEVVRAKAQLQLAINDEKRSKILRSERKDFISDAEMDQYRFGRMAQEAAVAVAETSVQQAQANLANSEANLAYTRIISPVDGIIIDRKVDPGQTVASQFQTPELFIVAPDMRKEMHIFASVDEADIGLIRQAQETGQPVRFTVDAYPDDLFEGRIFQIRRNSTTTQNVVTYPVLVSAPNPDLKLLPGMTATLSFQVSEANDVLLVPNSALRFYPQREQVRAEDRKLLDSSDIVAPAPADSSDPNSKVQETLSAEEKAGVRRNRNRRHVWAVEGSFLRAIEVRTGISDSQFTELVSGDLKVGQKLATRVQPKR